MSQMRMAHCGLGRRVRWLWVGAAVAAGAAVGLAGGRGPGSADLDPGQDQSKYTYGSSDCTVESRTDPVSVVFVGSEAWWEVVQVHAGWTDHGEWTHRSGDQQYFIDHYGYCQPHDGQAASANAISTRFHMRYNQGDINGVPDFDTSIRLSDGSTTTGYYTLASPHHEDFGLWQCIGPPPLYEPYPGHAVDGRDDAWPGGYVMGREELLERWLSAADGHVLIDVQDWGNVEQFEQCDGGVAWSDGLVYYIGMTCPDADPTIGLCNPDTTRVSVSSSGEQANDLSMQYVSAISNDGRFVPFYSFADNLVPDDNNGEWDAFVHDRSTGITERVSVSSSGEEADDWSYWHLAISADGRFVAFTSGATNLVPDDNNYSQDVFVRDRVAGITERVSVASGGAESEGWAQFPAISAGGRFVAFTAWAEDLVPDDTNGVDDVFVHDRLADTTERVSVSSSGEEGNDFSGDLSQISISADGRFVAFVSYASNLIPDDNNDDYDVFVHDRQTGETERVSVSSAGAESNEQDWWPSISDDGRYVAFESWSSNLVPGDTNTCRPQHDPGECGDVFVHDRSTGSTERVSVSSSGEEATDESEYPYISGSGRFVAFSSDAANLVPYDTNDAEDVFVHDRETGLTQRVSVSSTGDEADGDTAWTAINYDGTAVVFVSWATNLVADDTNGQSDVFVRSSTTDSDGDGIPDTEDNCPAWPNPDQSQPWWTLPFDDPDCDGWTTADEESIETDPAKQCAATTTGNDEEPDAWPPDFDDNQVINIVDLNKLLPPPLGFWGTSVPPTSPRYDIVPDGVINILDLNKLMPPPLGFWGETCTP